MNDMIRVMSQSRIKPRYCQGGGIYLGRMKVQGKRKTEKSVGGEEVVAGVALFLGQSSVCPSNC